MVKRNNKTKPASRRKLGCFGRLLILLLLVGSCYWILLSPISINDRDDDSNDSIVDGELNKVQEEALAMLKSETTEPLTVLAPDGQVQYLSAGVIVPDSIAKTYQEKTLLFISQNKRLFQIGDVRREFRFKNEYTDNLEITHIRYTQQYQGVPVYGSSVLVKINDNNEVVTFSANYVPNLEINVYPAVRSTEAKNLALQAFGADDAESIDATYLAIYAPKVWGGKNEIPRLAWFISIKSESLSESWIYVIDAQDGSLLDKFNLILEQGGQIDLEIWDEKASDNLISSPMLVMDENGAVKRSDEELIITSQDARDAFDNIKIVYDYFAEIHQHYSYNNEGGIIRIIVNRNTGNRAFWNPNNQTIHIDETWATGIDVLAHEFTHGVVQYSAHLGGGEARALNEAYADIFAAFIDSKEPWIISRTPRAIGDDNRRNLASPASHYPTKYREIYCDRVNPDCEKKCLPVKIDSYTDCGHINSILFSHSAFLANQNGISQEKMRHIYYYTLANGLNPSSTMKQAALATIGSCGILTGRHNINTNDCIHLKNAFITTGLILEPEQSPISLPYPSLKPIDDWLTKFQKSMREWFDNVIGDFRKKIEDYLQQLYEQLLDALKDGVNQLWQVLLKKLSALLEDVFENCCLGLAFPFAAPFVILRWQRKKT